MKKSRFQPFRQLMAVLTIGTYLPFLAACGGDSPMMPSAMPEVPAAAASGDNAPVKATSNEEEAICTLQADLTHETDDYYDYDQDGNLSMYLKAGSSFEVMFSHLPDSGWAHLAMYDASYPVGQQPVISKHIDKFVSSDRAFRLRVKVPADGDTVCYQAQIDAACGEKLPAGANYDSRQLIKVWRGGTLGCAPRPPQETPTPAPTPTPICNQGGDLRFSSLTGTCATPTPPPPTPTPTPTLPPHCEDGHGQDNEHGNCVTPTPTPRPTATPTPPSATPTPTPRPTSTPRPTPVPECDDIAATSSASQGFVLGNSSQSTETNWVNNNVDPGPYEFWAKHDDFDDNCTTAWFSAKVVLVKASTSYKYYLNVTPGQQLCSFTGQDISHITKFRCDD